MNPVAGNTLMDQLRHIADSAAVLLPEWVLICAFLLGIVAEIWPKGRLKPVVPWLALAGFAAAGVLASGRLGLWGAQAAGSGQFMGMVSADRFAAWVQVLVTVPGMLTVWASMRGRRLRAQGSGAGEHHLMLMAMVAGLYFLAMGRHLLMVFLALEMVSLPSYVLTAWQRMSRKGAEASLKYVIYGCFSSGLMLYGLSWVYGLTGTLDPTLDAFGEGLRAAPPWSVVMALLLVLGGLAFKVGSMPFHFWVPDVYEGASWPVAAFFAVGPKLAGFAALTRLGLAVGEVGGEPAAVMTMVLSVFAVGSMLVGNLAALRQRHFRRMLGYSSIAQAGYMMAGVALLSEAGATAVAFYLLVYGLMTFGAFLLAGWMEDELGIEELEGLKGLGAHLPGVAVAFTVLMVALTGLPPTAGFIGKLELLLALGLDMDGAGAGMRVALMAAIVLNTVISLFYYLRPPVMLVLRNAAFNTARPLHGWKAWAVGAIVAVLLWLGIISYDGLIHFIQQIVAEMAGQIRI